MDISALMETCESQESLIGIDVFKKESPCEIDFYIRKNDEIACFVTTYG
jgi:hypothetical protein